MRGSGRRRLGAKAGAADGDRLRFDADGDRGPDDVMAVAGAGEERDPPRPYQGLGVIEMGDDEIGDAVTVDIDTHF